jgi:hypothetical protein
VQRETASHEDSGSFREERAAFGLDLSLRSVDYVAGWGHPQGHDPEAFRVGMAAIHDGAASLIDAIEAAMTEAGERVLAA